MGVSNVIFGNMKALYQKIRTLNGKNYGLYKSLAEKTWDFGDFSLEFLHVQGDPFAPASRIMIKASLQMLGYSSEWGSTFERRLALSDFLLRRMSGLVKEKYPDRDAAVAFDVAGPEMLVRNSLWIDNGELRACLQVKLPGEGRKIQSESAAEILTMVLPDLVSASLYNSGSRNPEGVAPELLAHYQVLADRRMILEELEKRSLCAFVPDGAVLPRASGISQDPMEGAIPFVSPAELAVTLNVNGRDIRGMGIPKGITVITGGAFHGKSTLLQALTSAVYPHIPGDGREGIVIDESALRVGVEDGRSVRGTDLSQFVRDLPGGVSTRDFTTASASGSTSEAANLLEAMEAGSRTFLIDEDSSAVNFLIRDVRVRKLLGDDREPLIPLTDRIREICYPESHSELVSGSANALRSFILVAGACGDYLELADHIIVMANYKAEYARLDSERSVPALPPFKAPISRAFAEYIRPLQNSVRPTSAVERQVKVKLSGDYLIQIGFLVSDTSCLVTIADRQQRLGAGFILLNLCQNAISNGDSAQDTSIVDTIRIISEKIMNVGFRNLPQGLSREMSLPRPVDIACVLFRLRDQGRK
ncbi:putative ABC-class ATPase [Fibrobacter sp. UWR4]|nr:putative ABC-class ATPase [Fibrobacter sp. UWR4]PZW68096.1 putative ABC-class ATPase [Fibrobacter sp. UWR1]